jgi:translation elongation factor EF-4
MMLNGKPVDALAMIVHRSAAQQIGRAWTKKLRESVILHVWDQLMYQVTYFPVNCSR